MMFTSRLKKGHDFGEAGSSRQCAETSANFGFDFREPLKIHFQKDTWSGIIKIDKRGGQYHEEAGWHV